MRRRGAVVVALLGWAAASLAGPLHIELGTAFSLRPGEFAQTRDGALRVGFDAVTVDSRCPRGEQCAWAGDASVRVWLQQGGGPREARLLRLAAGAAVAVRLHGLGHELRLQRLAPHPAAGRPSAQADYVATLVLSRAGPGEPER